jgi:hypothetical protein
MQILQKAARAVMKGFLEAVSSPRGQVSEAAEVDNFP